MPVGFKWFVPGLADGSLGFGGEESAGASFLRQDGRVWTTDKDGILLALLAAEITARTGKDPGEHYREIAASARRAPLRPAGRSPPPRRRRPAWARSPPPTSTAPTLAGEPIREVLTRAPGNGAAIGGLKVTADNGWFAARPSGTENIYKIYAESFRGPEHLERIIQEARALVASATR